MPEVVPTEEVLAAFGRAVRKLRLERGITQEGLAEAAGIHPRYVSDVERGRRNVRTASTRLPREGRDSLSTGG